EPASHRRNNRKNPSYHSGNKIPHGLQGGNERPKCNKGTALHRREESPHSLQHRHNPREQRPRKPLHGCTEAGAHRVSDSRDNAAERLKRPRQSPPNHGNSAAHGLPHSVESCRETLPHWRDRTIHSLRRGREPVPDRGEDRRDTLPHARNEATNGTEH